MNNILYKKTNTHSFVVGPEKVNEANVLSICTLLDLVRSINDDAIVYYTGALDFNRISIQQCTLDVLYDAQLNDWLFLQSDIELYDGKISIRLLAEKKSPHKAITVLKGYFVFGIKTGLVPAYSLS